MPNYNTEEYQPELTPEPALEVSEEEFQQAPIDMDETTMEEPETAPEEAPEEETPSDVPVSPENTAAFKLGAFASSVLRGAGKAASSLSKKALEAGHALQTIQTKDGPVLVETAPDIIAPQDDELAELFEVPQEEDNDMYTRDLFEAPEEEEIGDLVGEEDMSDLWSMEEPLEAPKGRRIVKVVSRSRRGRQSPSGFGGMR